MAVYKKLLSEYHLLEKPEYVALSDYYMEEGYQAALNLLKHSNTFTAVIAVNDNAAVSAIRVFKDQGYFVPDDISLVSCDRFAVGSYTIPRITGISRDSSSIGSLLIYTLFQDMKGTTENISIETTPRLLAMESCRTIKN